MRKIVLILLILSAVPLYFWDTMQILGISFSRTMASRPASVQAGESATVAGAVDLFRISKSPTFVPHARDPFAPYATVARPIVKASIVSRPAGTATPKPAAPPPVTINSIMWNPANPVAIINLPDGSTTIVKPGQVLDIGITVKKIEKTRILVSSAGKDTWVER